MQIVIDIPEVFYEALRKTEVMVSGQRNGKTLMSVIYNAVANGTPLPEGHGNLIDRDALKLSEEQHTEMGEYNLNVEHTYCTRYYSVKEIKNAPTIIEAADKEIDK